MATTGNLNLSEEQRAAALDKARETRAARAKVMDELKSGKLAHKKALDKASSDPIIGRIKVKSFLVTLPGIGKARAEKFMDEAGIMANRRLQGLGVNQLAAVKAFCAEQK